MRPAFKNFGLLLDTLMTINDPYDIKQAIRESTLSELESDDVFMIAIKIAQDIQEFHHTITERQAYTYDQLVRASVSVCANYSQGCGKQRGYLLNDWLCARAEAYESYALLCLSPVQFKDLKSRSRELIQLLDMKILEVPEKFERPAFRQ